MHITFIFAFQKKRNDFADIIWGPGFVIASLGACVSEARNLENYQLGTKQIIIISCISIWALRLFLHIGFRNLKKSTEDVRYANWRKDWGKNWVWRSYLQVFILQGLIMYIIALPAIQAAHFNPEGLNTTVFLGLIIWIFGFLFESIGDLQLKKFVAISSNKGKIMDRGLWSWTRHPNYFGEVIQWWGIFMMVVTTPGIWWSLLSPVMITYMILKISGVTMLEELMQKRAGWDEYKCRTSAFIPMPPKKN